MCIAYGGYLCSKNLAENYIFLTEWHNDRIHKHIWCSKLVPLRLHFSIWNIEIYIIYSGALMHFDWSKWMVSWMIRREDVNSFFPTVVRIWGKTIKKTTQFSNCAHVYSQNIFYVIIFKIDWSVIQRLRKLSEESAVRDLVWPAHRASASLCFTVRSVFRKFRSVIGVSSNCFLSTITQKRSKSALDWYYKSSFDRIQ